jgi:hypothetical protein
MKTNGSPPEDRVEIANGLSHVPGTAFRGYHASATSLLSAAIAADKSCQTHRASDSPPSRGWGRRYPTPTCVISLRRTSYWIRKIAVQVGVLDDWSAA